MNADPENPVRVLFGAGMLDRIGELAGGRRYALLTYADPPFAGLAARVVRDAGAPALLFDRVVPNPSLDMLRTLCESARRIEAPIELCIALGGGSVIDAAKAFAFGHGDYDVLMDAVAGKPVPPRRVLPIIAIPTTAGTGSEVTCWATLWDTANGRKLSLERPDLYPEAAILDPLLMTGLSRQQTCASGLDALSHALESLWNRNADACSRGLAVESARIILDALLCALADPTSLHERTELARGALLAGYAFSRTRTALAHSLSYALTIDYGVPHGIACSFCLPAVMHAALGVSSDCDAAIEAIFGCAPSDAPAKLEVFLTSVGIAVHPSAYGVDAGAWKHVVAQAFDGARGRNFIGTPEAFPDFFAALPRAGKRQAHS